MWNGLSLLSPPTPRASGAQLLKTQHNGRGEGDRVDDTSLVVTSCNRGIVVTVRAAVRAVQQTARNFIDIDI